MLLTTFVCLSATLSTYAKLKEGGKIDKVKYEITYRTKSITDTTKVDSLGNFIYSKEDMRLEVGEQVSFFYSYSNALYEQQRIEMMNKGNFSVPNMLETTHYNNSSVSVLKNSQHLYLIGGYVFDLTENTKFKPAVLSKVSFGAPLQLDFSANFMFNEKFVIGGAYRWSAAVSVMAGFQINDRWFAGYGYDFETTELRKYNSGSHEIFLRYELVKTYKKIVSPRFF